MNKKQLIVAWLVLCVSYPSASHSIGVSSYEEQKQKPFLGFEYKNIRWIKHIPINTAEDLKEGFIGQTDIGKVDLDGDGKEETIKVIWGPGVTDHSLTIELLKGKKGIISFNAPGIQPNFKIEDVDGDKKLELVVWGAVDDPKMGQLLSDKSKPFEGHSDPHLFKVKIYKIEQGKCRLFNSYTSKKKYEPFCGEQPKK